MIKKTDNVSNDIKSTLKNKFKLTQKFQKDFDGLKDSTLHVTSCANIIKFVDSRLQNFQISEVISNAEIIYVLKRSVCGTAAKNINYRRGCQEILKTLLHKHQSVFSFVREYSSEYFRGENSNGEYAEGHALVLGAIISSGALKEFDDSSTTQCVQTLNQLRCKSDSCNFLALEALSDLAAMNSDVFSLKDFVKSSLDSLKGDVGALSPGNLRLKIRLCQPPYEKHLRDSAQPFRASLINASAHKHILDTAKDLCRKYIDVDSYWHEYFTLLFSHSAGSTKSSEENVALFFSLITLSESAEQAGYALRLIEIAMTHVTCPAHVEAALSVALLEQLVSLKSSSQAMASLVDKFFASLVQIVCTLKMSSSEAECAVVSQILRTKYSARFDAASKSQLLLRLSEQLSEAGLAHYASLLAEAMNSQALSTDKVYAARLLSQLLSQSASTAVPESSSDGAGCDAFGWRADRIWDLAELAFFRAKDVDSADFEDVNKQLVECFTRSLNCQPGSVDNQLAVWWPVARRLTDRLKVGAADCRLSQHDSARFLSWTKSLKRELKRSPFVGSPYFNIFKLLYCIIIIYLFVNPSDAADLFESVDGAYDSARSKISSPKKKSKSEREAEIAVVVVDLLIGLFEAEESFWRKVAKSVVRCLCPHWNNECLLLVLDVIDPAKLQEAGLDGENDRSDADSEDGESDEVGSLGDSTENGDIVDEEKLIKLKMEMQKLVGIPGEDDVDLDSVPAEELSSLDERLGAMMKEFVGMQQKRKPAKDQKALVQAKAKCCDILEVVMDECPSLESVASAAFPLVGALDEAAKDKGFKPLETRVRYLFTSLAKAKKFASVGSDPNLVLVEQFRKFLTSKYKASKRVAKEFSISCTFFMRASLELSHSGYRTEPKELFKMYSDYMEKELRKEVFTGPLRMKTEHLSVVLERLAVLSFCDGLPAFARTRAIRMTQTLLTNQGATSLIQRKFLSDILLDLSANVIKVYESVEGGKDVHCCYLVALNEFIITLYKLKKRKFDWLDCFQFLRVEAAISSLVQRLSLGEYKALRKSFHSLSSHLASKIIFSTSFGSSGATKKRKSNNAEITNDEEEFISRTKKKPFGKTKKTSALTEFPDSNLESETKSHPSEISSKVHRVKKKIKSAETRDLTKKLASGSEEKDIPESKSAYRASDCDRKPRRKKLKHKKAKMTL